MADERFFLINLDQNFLPFQKLIFWLIFWWRYFETISTDFKCFSTNLVVLCWFKYAERFSKEHISQLFFFHCRILCKILNISHYYHIFVRRTSCFMILAWRGTKQNLEGKKNFKIISIVFFCCQVWPSTSDDTSGMKPPLTWLRRSAALATETIIWGD